MVVKLWTLRVKTNTSKTIVMRIEVGEIRRFTNLDKTFVVANEVDRSMFIIIPLHDTDVFNTNIPITIEGKDFYAVLSYSYVHIRFLAHTEKVGYTNKEILNILIELVRNRKLNDQQRNILRKIMEFYGSLTWASLALEESD